MKTENGKIEIPVLESCLRACISLFESEKDKVILDTMLQTIKEYYCCDGDKENANR